MTRRTSIDVYHAIEREGLLGRLQLLVYRTLFQVSKPMTQMEVVREIGNPNITDHGITPRFSELKRMGAIADIGTKTCLVSGRETTAWVITGEMPVKGVGMKKPTRKHLESKISRYQELCQKLVTYLEGKKLPKGAKVLKERIGEIEAL